MSRSAQRTRRRWPSRAQAATALARGTAELAKAGLCGAAAFVFCTAWHAAGAADPDLAAAVRAGSAEPSMTVVEPPPSAPLARRAGIGTGLR